MIGFHIRHLYPSVWLLMACAMLGLPGVAYSDEEDSDPAVVVDVTGGVDETGSPVDESDSLPSGDAAAVETPTEGSDGADDEVADDNPDAFLTAEGKEPPDADTAEDRPADASRMRGEGGMATATPSETPGSEPSSGFPPGAAPGGRPPGAGRGPGFPPGATEGMPGRGPADESRGIRLPNPAAAGSAGGNELVFNFAGADWRMVLEWLSDQAGLALQADRYPPGTVNYVDTSRTYTLNEAMDVINRLLLDRGYALIKRGRQLILIDQESETAAGLISELAELVTVEELDTRGNSDIVRCVFSLGGLAPDVAKVEIAQLVGPAGRLIVLDSAKQVVVTETVARLKAIRTLLENASEASSDVTEIVLQYRVADELLDIARPLIGLEPGVNSSEKIRIATGLYGDRLYATGDAATRALLQRIIERADTPLQNTSSESGGREQSLPRLETYVVSSVAPATVIDVLQTLLAGMPDTRIATDPQAGGIIAYARPETHVMIQQTIDKLEGRGSTFEIIQLRRLEPAQALLTINKFFGTTDATKKDAPTIDGDPVTGRLWVRGTPEQIALVKNLIEKLEGSDALGPMGDRIRVLPYTGRSAEEAIEQLQNVWQAVGRKNKIRMVTPSGGVGGGSASGGNSFPQRRIGGLAAPSTRARGGEPGDGNLNRENDNTLFEIPASAPESDAPFERQQRTKLLPDEARRTQDVVPNRPADRMTFVSDTSAANSLVAGLPVDSDQPFDAADESQSADESAAGPAVQAEKKMEPKAPDGTGDIVITMTPGGMVIASDDPLALSDFEQMMRTLSDQTATAGAEPTVFWLKYAKAPEAADMVTKVLGGDTGDSGGGGGLASAMLGGVGGGMLGGLLGLGGGGGGDSGAGPILTTTGSVSIVADGRLNALIVQANAVDMRTIEMILEVVDREESPEDVRTTSKPQLIPVIYQNAADVAVIVKSVYADRSGEQRAGGGGGGQPQMSPQDLINAIRGGGGGRGGRGGGSEQATKPAPVTIAVDSRSNSLIVTAPPQDVEDIRELVEAIDAGGMESEETVEIVSLKGTVKAEVVQQALDSILGTKAKTTTASAAQATGGGQPPAAPGQSPEDIQRRIEFFRQMRQGGGFGGGPPGGGGFGGGAPGGGGFGGGGRGGRGGGGGAPGGGGSRGGGR